MSSPNKLAHDTFTKRISAPAPATPPLLQTLPQKAALVAKSSAADHTPGPVKTYRVGNRDLVWGKNLFPMQNSNDLYNVATNANSDRTEAEIEAARAALLQRLNSDGFLFIRGALSRS